MRKLNYEKIITQVIIAGLVFTGVILVLLKLLFLPFYATEKRPYTNYTKDSIIGTKHSVDLVYIKKIPNDEYTINPNDSHKNIIYYYGFDRNYNVALVAIDTADATVMENLLNDKNSTNRRFYGTIINSPVATGYIQDYNSDPYNLFDNNNSFDAQDFSVESFNDPLTIDKVINEYSVLKIDLNDQGIEVIKTGLGWGAYAVFLAIALFIIAIILSIKMWREENPRKPDTYFIIE